MKQFNRQFAEQGEKFITWEKFDIVQDSLEETLQQLTDNRYFIIKDDGKMGVGTDEPDSQLHVAGDIEVEGQIDCDSIFRINGASCMYLDDSGNLTIGAGTGVSNNLILESGGGTTAVTIDSNQDVGIGISSPNNKLHIDGCIQISGTDGTYAAGCLGYTDSNWGFLYRPPRAGTSGAHLFESYDGTNLLRIRENGNVGIGKNPSYKLDVAGQVDCDSIFRINGAACMYLDGSGNLTIGSGTGVSNNLILESGGGATAVTIDSDQDVGIGVTNPLHRLHVEDNVAGYVARFENDGNNANRYGIIIQAGADAASGTTTYIICYDGDGDTVGYIENNSGTFQLVDSSDKRIKANIADSKVEALDIIQNLKVREFEKRGQYKSAGFVAQECAKVFPEMVSIPEDEEGTWGVSATALIPVLVKAIQQQQKQIDNLKNARRKNG